MPLFYDEDIIASGGNAGSNDIPREQIENIVYSYLDSNPIELDKQYIFQVGGINHPGCYFKRNGNTGSVLYTGAIYNCIEADVTNVDVIHYCGQDGGGVGMCTCFFVDSEDNIINTDEEYSKGKCYRNVVRKVPVNATKVYISGTAGGSGMGAYLELSTNGIRSNYISSQSLSKAMWNRWKARDEFAWRPNMPTLIAFTIDDTLGDNQSNNTVGINQLVDLAIEKGVPLCFGCIPEKLSMTFDSSESKESAAEVMHRAIKHGGEVLAHGSGEFGCFNSETADDNDFLFQKFVMDKQKLIDAGFDVRGIVRVGGKRHEVDHIDEDPRSELWVRTLYDYSDLYGTTEPYNHARISAGSTFEQNKQIIDNAISRGGFIPLLFHALELEMATRLFDYLKEKENIGECTLCNYAYAYDNYGTTKLQADLERRIIALEEHGSAPDGNEEEY